MTSGKGFSLITALMLGTALASCSLAPDYKTPEVATTPAFEESGDWIPAKPADGAARGPWWQVFGDPQLNALEDQVTAANQNLKAALAQYDEARAAASAARADYFPTVTGNAGYTRARNSMTVAVASSVTTFNDFIVGADLNYEIDVWGRVRNAVAAAADQAQASKADLAAINLSLHAELATDYFALRGDDALQSVLDKTVDVYQQALVLVENRLKGGIATSVDLSQAETQLENARTQATDMRLQRAQLEHAIAVLTGQPPAVFHQPPAPLGDTPPPVADPGLPSTLLERRPDIAATERQAAAANAEIGVARAAWFPTFSLTGMLGFESGSAANWLIAPSHFWSLGPSAAMTLFDAGRISSLSDEARAAYEEAAANYRQTVLSAYQDVEDNLVALHRLAEESKSQEAALKAARRALAQENDLYRNGAVTYLDVSVVQNTVLQAEISAMNIRVRRWAASVQLIKALGGGWQASELAEDSAAKDSAKN